MTMNIISLLGQYYDDIDVTTMRLNLINISFESLDKELVTCHNVLTWKTGKSAATVVSVISKSQCNVL